MMRRRMWLVRNNPVEQKLQIANQMLDEGKFGSAAALFHELAVGATNQSGPRAPIFLIQEGFCEMRAGNTEAGFERSMEGLTMLKNQKLLAQLARIGTLLENQLMQINRVDLANQVKAFLASSGIKTKLAKKTQREIPNIKLPLKCPACGAGINPAEVEWIGADTIECLYCGKLIRGENI